ncbi:hypothetical protein KM918_26995 [Priestia megaterium]|uniref:hypothetical protein n=1 Tax=Priestia megaterium TaxID=1404 RepID=UPI001C242DCC|nr:hypothetical protein [Priestia megaterium]MBU8690935.1 hypothetical protein [Priestia megaterium]
MKKLFTGNAVKRVNKVLDKAESRRTKLEEKVATLQNDVKVLREAIQDDFNDAILEDREPNKKLEKELKKVNEELQSTQFQLSQIDAVIKSEMEKQKEAIDRERKDYVADKREEFHQLFAELNDLKLAYLNKLIEYSEKKKAYNNEYSRTFRDIENRVGIRRHDARDDFRLYLNQTSQSVDNYSPLVFNDELREALNGGMVFATKKNKDAFKK